MTRTGNRRRIEEETEWKWIDAACDDFESAWRSGDVPRLEDRMALQGAWRDLLFRELLSVEIEERRRRGEVPTVREYVERFPDRGNDVKAAFERSRDPDRGLVPGERLGAYRIKRRIESGSFGRVYLASDKRLGRQVAIKVAQRQVGKAKNALLAEARTLAGLDHPGIVRIYDVGSFGDSGIFLVMEYMDHGTLADRLQRCRLPWETVAEFGAQIADALHFVHRKGIVHRDLKPANILFDHSGHLRLSDFGLSGTAPEIRSALEGDAGTPCYMAPEQFDESPCSQTASDIWALGVILYESLTGRRPYTVEQLRLCGNGERLAPPPPPHHVEPNLPRWFSRLVLKCLRQRPEDRPASAAQIVELIRRHQTMSRKCAARRGIMVGMTGAVAGLSWFAGRHSWFAGTPDNECHLDLLVWAKRDGHAVARSISEPGVAPLRDGDLIRVRWQASRPWWVYLVWMDGRGRVSAIYPRVEGGITGWADAPEAPRRELSLPPRADVGWPMKVPRTGMEALVALAGPHRLNRRGMDSVRDAFSMWKPVRLADTSSFYLFRGSILQHVARRRTRSPQVGRTVPLADPVVVNQTRLVRSLRSLFPAISTICFSCVAGSGSTP